MDTSQGMGRGRINDTREKVLEFQRDHLRARRYPAPMAVIAAAVNRAPQTVAFHLQRLVDAGLMYVDNGRYLPVEPDDQPPPSAPAMRVAS